MIGENSDIGNRSPSHTRLRLRGVSWSGEIVGQNQQTRTISDIIAPTVTPQGVKIAMTMLPPPKMASSSGRMVGPLNS